MNILCLDKINIVLHIKFPQDLAQASTILTTGRAALQKRIMALLRKIESCTYGVWQVKCYLARCLGVLLIAACCRRSRTLL